jgi:hypothetical protein
VLRQQSAQLRFERHFLFQASIGLYRAQISRSSLQKRRFSQSMRGQSGNTDFFNRVGQKRPVVSGCFLWATAIFFTIRYGLDGEGLATIRAACTRAYICLAITNAPIDSDSHANTLPSTLAV